MSMQLVIRYVVAFLVFAAFAGLTPRAAAASDRVPPAGLVDSTDADFCFGPGNQGVGFACNSACFGSVDPSYFSLPISCPGPASAITFAPSPTNVSCASQSTLTITVSDVKGYAVADDTVVTFTTDVGSVSPITATASGLTTISLTVPPKTSGVAHIVASVGGVRGDKSVAISC